METNMLNLEGVPAPVVRGIEIVAQMAKNLAGVADTQRRPAALGIRKGTVLTPIDRDAIYSDGEQEAEVDAR